MAIKFVSVKCPECGANLDVEEGRTQLFCSYCGAKVMIDNENEKICRHIDEAGVKQAEADKIIRLKELEIEERELEKSRKDRYKAFGIAGGMAALGFVIIALANSEGTQVIGGFLIMIAIYVALFAIPSERNKKIRRSASSHEAQIKENMTYNKEKNYNGVVAKFRAAGFTNVTAVPLHDLNIFTSNKNGQVEEVTINGESGFEEGDVYPKTAIVTITYHSTN